MVVKGKVRGRAGSGKGETKRSQRLCIIIIFKVGAFGFL